MATTDGTDPAPRVFVSYSHDSREHMDRVLALSDRLRHEGVAVELDQYEPSPPEGWPRWTARMVEQADFVLVVCTETYRRRFDGNEEAGKGLGVRWEGAAVAQILYDAGAQNRKFLPVLFQRADDAHIPLPLRGATRFPISDEDGYEQLYRHLTDQPAVPRPDLGARRALPPRRRRTDFSSADPQEPGSRRKRIAGAIVLVLALLTVLVWAFAREKTRPPVAAPVVAQRAVLQGEVLDDQSREPLAGVVVRLPEYDRAQTTTETGKYHFELSAPAAASIKLRATKPGYRSLRLDLPPGKHLNVHHMRREP